MADNEKPPKCSDCLEERGSCFRQSDYVGPRGIALCRTHYHARARAKKVQAHRRMVERTYNLPEGDYDRLYEFQDGLCALCRRANGRTKNLSVDHDHKCCNRRGSCGRCPRGLLCARCNALLGHARDDVEFFHRAADYLNDPPYRTMKDRES